MNRVWPIGVATPFFYARMKKFPFLADLVALVFFVVLSFAYFLPSTLDGRILFRHDTSAGVGAGQEATSYLEATGERTRWTNALFGGMPTYQMSPSYESGQGLSWFEQAYRLFLPDYVMHLFILLVGFYLLMRALRMSAWLSTLGAVLWAFSSYFFILIAAGHLWKFITLAYIPPTLAGLVWVMRGRYLLGGLTTAVFMALQLRANHVQMSYYFGFVILFLLMAYGVEAWRSGQMQRFAKGCAVLAVAAVLGVGANLSNLYHTYQYSKETMRGPGELTAKVKSTQDSGGGLEKDYITQWSYGVDETLTLLIPNLKGGASEPLADNERAMSKADGRLASAGIYGQLTQYFGEQPMTAGPVYVGAFVLFLFLFGCFVVKGPMKWALVAATLFSIVLSWGRNFMPPTDFFIDYVPLYNKFRAVSSILVIAEFTIPLLAILGLNEILKQPRGILTADYRRALLAALASTAGVAFLVALVPDLLSDGFVSTQERAMLTQSIPGDYLPLLLGNLQEMRAALVTADAWRSFFLVSAGVLLLLMHATGRLKAVWTVALVGLLCVVDMWAVNKRYLNDEMFVSASQRTDTFRKTAADEYILQDTTLNYRVLNLATNTFNENNTSYHHKSVGGYHAAKLRRYQELIDYRLAPEMQAAYQAIVAAGGVMDSVSPHAFRTLNMLNTRYFIFPGGANGQQTIPIRNPYAYGHAWFVDTVQTVGSADEEMEALAHIEPLTTAVIDRTKFADAPQSVSRDSAATIRLVSYRPNRLVYEAASSQAGLVVFSEIYYPGWQVAVDGQPAELMRANYVLRTMNLPAGQHRIEMWFDPASLHFTEAVGYASSICLLLGLVVLMVRAVRRKSVEEE